MSDADPSATSSPQVIYDHADKRTRTLPLAYPFSFDGERIESVTLRRLCGGEVIELQKLLAERGFVIEEVVYYLTDRNEGVIAALDEDDWGDLLDAAHDFLPKRLREAIADTLAALEASQLQDPSLSASPSPQDGDEKIS